MSEGNENEVRGPLSGAQYEVVRAAYDWERKLRETVGKDIKDMSFSEYVIALAAVTASARMREV